MRQLFNWTIKKIFGPVWEQAKQVREIDYDAVVEDMISSMGLDKDPTNQ